MNCKMRKLLSGVLAFVMMFGAMFSNFIVTSAAEEEESGASFVFWADENLDANNKLAAGSYVVNGADISINANTALPEKSSASVCDGHKAYQIGKYNDKYFGSVSFTAAADGWATLYMYLPDGKAMYISETEAGSSAADKQTISDTAMPYTFAVTAGTTYYMSTDKTNDFSIYGIGFIKKEIVTVSGNITVSSEDGNTIAEGSVLTFTNNTSGEEFRAVLSAGASDYSLQLYKNFDYTCRFSGTDTLIINTDDASLSVSASAESNILDVTLVDAQPQIVTGTVYGPCGAETTVKFGNNAPIAVTIGSNGEGTYSTELKPGSYSVSVGQISGYTPSSLSESNVVVRVNSDENYKNILYTKSVPPASAYDVYVDGAGTYYTNESNVYTNLTDAMAAIDSSSLKGSAKQRFVVHVAPGLYEEQFFVNSDYVSIIADSNGDGIADGDVKFSWYYGIDYMYYSIDPVTGFYSKEYAVDRHTKTTCVQKWGSAVIVKGSNFYSEGIVYQNTFNLELREAELADGVECDLSPDSANNTSYDRTQENADVRLTTATERAAALVIDGQQAEFYNCSFLGSQDTVYTGSYSHYFKDCLLAGETDYIFGNGGTTIFDNCELMWMDYHYEAQTDDKIKYKAGYIAVPRGSYIFRDCEITAGNDGLNVTTGTKVQTPGYYGRPWGTTAEALFMNCKTNGLILADGWKDMSGIQPAQAAFREYNNLAEDNTTVFYSNIAQNTPMPDGSSRILTADEANELTAEKDWNIFGTWLPMSHVPYAGNPNIYKFDFTNGNIASPVSDSTETAQLTHSGMKYHGKTYGATMGNGSTMTIYAGSDGETMDIYVNSSYNGNAGTLELYKNDELVSDSAVEFDNSTDNESITFNLTDVKSGDSYTVKYIGTSVFYCGDVTVNTDSVLTDAPVTNTYDYDFCTAAAGHSQGDTATGELYDKNNTAPITLGSGIKYHGTSYGFMIGNNADISFDVVSGGKATITVPSSYQENSGRVKLYSGDTLIASTDSLTGIMDGTVKADLSEGTYTLKYDVTGTFYTKGLTIATTGELGQLD